MPVVAHCEEGLVIDVFGEHPIKFICDGYDVKSDKLACFCGSFLKYYDLSTKKLIKEYQVSEAREVKLTPNGNIIGVLTNKNELFVFDDTKLLFMEENVYDFKVSNQVIAAICKDSFNIKKIKDRAIEPTPFYTLKSPIMDFSVHEHIVFITTKKTSKDSKHKIIKIEGESVQTIKELETLQNIKISVHSNLKYAILLLFTSYVNNSYFADSELFFYNFSTQKLKQINECKMLHYFTFMSNGFAVCHGEQPSCVTFFDFDCISKKTISKRGQKSDIFKPA